MRLFLIPLLVILPLLCFGQIGLRAAYGKSNFEQFKDQAYVLESNKNASFLGNATTFGIDYWFRLKKRRIEFLPELAVTFYGNSTINTVQYKSNSIDFYFNTHIYLLDLAEDCNCPTFSKQGNTIKKGFFFHIAPMVKSFNLSSIDEIKSTKTSSLTAGIRAGFGLDIGINDLITVTPIVSYERSTMAVWKDMTAINQPDIEGQDILSNYSKLSAEVRLGLRFIGSTKKFRR
jgi:hypothetical protein